MTAPIVKDPNSTSGQTHPASDGYDANNGVRYVQRCKHCRGKSTIVVFQTKFGMRLNGMEITVMASGMIHGKCPACFKFWQWQS